MSYRVVYRPSKSRPGEPWAKVLKSTGKIVSRHRSKRRAQASIRAYYASRGPTKNLRAANHAPPSPLRLDPTRTLMLRKSFARAIIRKLRKFREHLLEFIQEKDVFGLRPRNSFVILATTFLR